MSAIQNLALYCLCAHFNQERKLPAIEHLEAIKSVTSYFHPDSVNFSFVWAHGTYKTAVDDLASW